ncbi:U-scoloptoxin(20)-Cw1a-like [Lucilia sericata]|uniref:U-scoloptoxin(20)-Cw1a-like n=1 Tax=Lucilia sericata TaxID=13632 RepID=UPI0018A81241|nr:U-scoloptoxin(20)-Cw1a-like [Lucilia sericata]
MFALCRSKHIFNAILSVSAIPCDSCGNECANACGTKHFRTCCFNYLRKRTDPNAMKMITNKRLIDFIMLQGRAMFTQNELSNERKQQQQQQQKQQQQQYEHLHEQQKLLIPRSAFPFNDEERHNGTFILEDLQAYYD